uniref:Transmembrane protein n=1 Tax=Tanacetum cinerariifolium TaxID=118510 RepID=A0A6L2PB65_TANCI|nr:hypothetical protein [Tanacetum cinerariifolium]
MKMVSLIGGGGCCDGGCGGFCDIYSGGDVGGIPSTVGYSKLVISVCAFSGAGLCGIVLLLFVVCNYILECLLVLMADNVAFGGSGSWEILSPLWA